MPKVTGNEAGTKGGVVSGVNKGICNPLTYASKTRINGQHALSHDLVMEMNAATAAPAGDTRKITTRDKTSVEDIEIALIPGHEPGGGAKGEREYNIKVAKLLKAKLDKLGAKVIIYEHALKPYAARQNAMAKAVRKLQPTNKICIELHYDAVSSAGPAGYHYQYFSKKGEILAGCFRDQWKAKYPKREARRDKGIMHNTSKNGSGFLKKAPGVAVLTEPFFRSNPSEWAYFKDKHDEVASLYAAAIEEYCSKVPH